jgi:Na+/melibiose symporter-like transporter
MPDEQIELDAEKILELEFEYARTTAEQAQDDRTAIMTLYLLLVGGVGSAIAAITQTSLTPGSSVPHIALALIFFLLGITGFFTLMKLVRLRQAWNDSAMAMNQIKDFYRERFPELNKAFRWKTETIPPPGKPWTITFNLVLLVAIIDSVAMGIAVYFTDWRVPYGEYVIATFVAVVFIFWQLWYYFYQLPMSDKG